MDGQGLPLVPAVTAATINDGVLLAAMVDDRPKVATPAGRRRSRPGKLPTDKASDSKDHRADLRQRGIIPRLARRGLESSTTLGRHRWKLQRSLSWLSCYRRLQVRWEHDSARFFAFVLLACALVCCKRALAGHNQRHVVG